MSVQYSIHASFWLEGLSICPCASPSTYPVSSGPASFISYAFLLLQMEFVRISCLLGWEISYILCLHNNLIISILTSSKCRCLVQVRLQLKPIARVLEPSTPYRPPCKMGICPHTFACMSRVTSTALSVTKRISVHWARLVFELFILQLKECSF